MFPGHLISQRGDIPWPSHSPDLTAADFFLWGFLKSRVYRTRPRTLQDLEDNIRNELINIPHDVLRRTVDGSFIGRLHECVVENGDHLTGVIFKH